METTATFSISSTGETTNQAYNGSFTVKTLLSVRDRLAIDEERRMILGSDGQNADNMAKIFANMISQLRIRIVKAPEFWTEAGNGIDLLDYNVLVEIFQLVVKKEEERKKEIIDQAEKARTELKSTVE